MNRIEGLFRNLFPVLILLFITGTIWGPLVFPVIYTGFALVYSVMFGGMTLLLAYRYSTMAAFIRESHVKPIQSYDIKYTHLIIIPNYNETLQTLRATLKALSCHFASKHYVVCLAMEQSELQHTSKALILSAEYEDNFAQIMYTVHPPGIDGEIAGKASNVNWAARQCFEKFSGQLDIIVTIADADTVFDQRYFLYMDNEMVKSTNPGSVDVMFAPPVLFNRNSLSVPSVVRVTDIQWCSFAYATFGLYDGIGFPMSVYSLPMELAHRVGFWDTCASAIGEDMHMFLKCFFETNGALCTKTVPYPVSQTNVEGVTFVDTIKERFTQANRHALGVQDTPYCWAQSTCTVFPGMYTVKWSAVILLMFTIQFMPITNVFLLAALNYLPYVQPLYRTTAMKIIWMFVHIIITGSSFIALGLISVAYQKTHNLLSVKKEQRDVGHMIMDGLWVPISAFIFFVVPIVRACILLLFGSKLLNIYESSRKPTE